MSDTSQGPGWWLASDGKWYPPSGTPVAPVPPPPPAMPYAGGPRPSGGGTNGLAIASLVLGLLWLCGVGSLLAIVFGLIALSQTKANRQGGRGLAIAGLVIGVIGTVATVVALIALFATASTVVDDLSEFDGDEFDDVQILECGQGPDGRGVALLEITNDSSRESTYLIEVEFREPGTGDVSTGSFEMADGVGPGETVQREVVSSETVATERVSCRLEFVERFASG